jgi:hypothetical protein
MQLHKIRIPTANVEVVRALLFDSDDVFLMLISILLVKFDNGTYSMGVIP